MNKKQLIQAGKILVHTEIFESDEKGQIPVIHHLEYPLIHRSVQAVDYAEHKGPGNQAI